MNSLPAVKPASNCFSDLEKCARSGEIPEPTVTVGMREVMRVKLCSRLLLAYAHGPGIFIPGPFLFDRGGRQYLCQVPANIEYAKP